MAPSPDFIVPGIRPPRLGVYRGASGRPSVAQSLPKIIAAAFGTTPPLLEQMNGTEAPANWRGALPITYRFSGAVNVHVRG